MNRAERREKALIIWEEKIRLIPTDVQLDGAIWDVQSEVAEVAEELVEMIRAARNFPMATKQELFFPISDT